MADKQHAVMDFGNTSNALKRAEKKKTNRQKRLTQKEIEEIMNSSEQEACLASYLELTSRMFHGLTSTNTKRLAYEMAVKKWNKNITIMARERVSWQNG
ncbi:hypothetical protein RRG08_025270 [Elysia crispata]|uniref:Uncharacterized protein n=1 Tax=Elysia crispata TaxID=231223 RepID=A0AAE1DV40_9GAST|nr:hypothetical protein RRG08_025270 [Elysia crispata]